MDGFAAKLLCWFAFSQMTRHVIHNGIALYRFRVLSAKYPVLQTMWSILWTPSTDVSMDNDWVVVDGPKKLIVHDYNE